MNRLAMLTMIVALVLSGTALSGRADFFTWDASAGSNDWLGTIRISPDDEAPLYRNNWGRVGNPAAQPQAGDDVEIGPLADKPAPTLAASAGVGNLTIQGGTGVSISGGHLGISGDSLNSFGDVAIDNSTLQFSGAQPKMTGGGRITLSRGSLTGAGGNEVTNQNLYIRGGGSIANMSLINRSTIEAADGGTITISCGQSTNEGSFLASANSTLTLSGGQWQNTGAIAAAGSGAVVEISGATVTGGAIRSGEGAKAQINNGATLKNLVLEVYDAEVYGNAMLDNVSIQGQVQVPEWQTARSQFCLNVDGAMAIAPHATLNVYGATRITGPGELRLEGGTIGGSGQLINQAASIHGYGNLGSPANPVENQTAIIADVAGMAMVMEGASVTNKAGMAAAHGGTMQFAHAAVANQSSIEADGGTVLFVDSAVANDGGRIAARPDSTVTVSGGYIAGGTLTTEGTGSIDLEASARLSDLVNEGAVAVKAGKSGTLTGGIANAGTLKVDGGWMGVSAQVTQSGNGEMLADGGTVQFTNGGGLARGKTRTANGGKMYASGPATIGITDITNEGYWLVENGAIVNVAGTRFANTGTFNVGGYAGGYGPATLRLAANVEATGAGEILLSPGHIDSPEGYSLTNAAGHTIRGAGYVSAAVVNNGLMEADRSFGYYSSLDLRGAAKTNNAIIRATSGGYVDLQTSVNQSAGGQIMADVASTVRLFNGSAITGGMTTTSGSGRFSITGGGVATTITDITNHGYWLVENGAIVNLGGTTFANDETFNVGGYAGGYGPATLRLTANVEAKGTGEILLSPGTIDSPDGYSLTNAAEHTIRGWGTISAGIENFGLVDADRTGNLALNGAAKINHGTIKASNGRYLEIRTTLNQSSNGRLLADGGNVFLDNGTVINGGVMDTTNDSLIYIENTYPYTRSAVLNDVTNRGHFLGQNGATIYLTGSAFTNSGTFELGGYTGGYGPATLRLAANVEAKGTGEILLSPGYINSPDGYSLTNAAGHAIRGWGTISAGIENFGLIEADRTGNLVLNGAAKTNHGTLKASNGLQIVLQTTLNQSANGRLLADGGNVLLDNGTVISGGLMDTVNGGLIYIISSSYFTRTAVLTDITNRGHFLGQDGSITYLTGSTFTNDGTFEIGGYASHYGPGTVSVTNGLVLQGTGTIRLGTGYMNSDASATVVNMAGHTISGGYGRVFGNVVIDNQGTLEAYNGQLVVDSNPLQFVDSVLTGGTWRATNGTLSINGGAGAVTVNQGNVILNGSSSFWQINSLADNQGLFSILNGRNFTTAGSLANSGTIDIGAGSTLTVNGNYTPAVGSTTTVNGNLVVNGGSMRVLGSLGGSGRVGNTTITTGAILAPGNSPGTLETGHLNLEDGAIYNWDISSTDHDLTIVNGNLAFDSTATLNVLLYGDELPAGGDYALFAVSGTIGALPEWTIQLPSGWVSYGVVISGNDVILSNVQVPEPATLSLLALGTMAMLRRRKLKP